VTSRRQSSFHLRPNSFKILMSPKLTLRVSHLRDFAGAPSARQPHGTPPAHGPVMRASAQARTVTKVMAVVREPKEPEVRGTTRDLKGKGAHRQHTTKQRGNGLAQNFHHRLQAVSDRNKANRSSWHLLLNLPLKVSCCSC